MCKIDITKGIKGPKQKLEETYQVIGPLSRPAVIEQPTECLEICACNGVTTSDCLELEFNSFKVNSILTMCIERTLMFSS